MSVRPRGRASRSSLIVSLAADRQKAAVGRGLARWLAGAAPRTARGTVTVALVSDPAMRALNKMFRGVDAVTDVLSFPDDGDPNQPRHERSLGEIAIAAGVAARQARREGHSSATELRILALHGLLHLLGYDHERDRGEMRKVEERLRRRAGLPVGLIARAPAGLVRR